MQYGVVITEKKKVEILDWVRVQREEPTELSVEERLAAALAYIEGLASTCQIHRMGGEFQVHIWG